VGLAVPLAVPDPVALGVNVAVFAVELADHESDVGAQVPARPPVIVGVIVPVYGPPLGVKVKLLDALSLYPLDGPVRVNTVAAAPDEIVTLAVAVRPGRSIDAPVTVALVPDPGAVHTSVASAPDTVPAEADHANVSPVSAVERVKLCVPLGTTVGVGGAIVSAGIPPTAPAHRPRIASWPSVDVPAMTRMPHEPVEVIGKAPPSVME
jgi:hypothetical protein